MSDWKEVLNRANFILEREDSSVAQELKGIVNYYNNGLMWKKINEDLQRTNQRTADLAFTLILLDNNEQTIDEVKAILNFDFDYSKYAQEYFKENNIYKIDDYYETLKEKIKDFGFWLDKEWFDLGKQVRWKISNGIYEYIQVDKSLNANFFENANEFVEKILEHGIKEKIKNIQFNLSSEHFEIDEQGARNILNAKLFDNVSITSFCNQIESNIKLLNQNNEEKKRDLYIQYVEDIVNDLWNEGFAYKTFKTLGLDASFENVVQVHDLLDSEYEDLQKLDIVNEYIDNYEAILKDAESWEDFIEEEIKDGINDKKIDPFSFIKLANKVYNETEDNEFYAYDEHYLLIKIPREKFIDGVIDYMYENKVQELQEKQKQEEEQVQKQTKAKVMVM
ncbi:hypothetical protein [Mycoplasma sp. 3686d]|uniref:hypothetical protein n=1 Tax=Mycoplasma sp. 3686d TaxID=2967300 RepID=UPI00211C2AC5|nr:hypothetical protein [Mycoplasma sp. 3686d]UUM24644.1 hypothetical protein NPA12_03030 [Mycoplasma sp. 3686d]